jgi:hypothetical protein
MDYIKKISTSEYEKLGVVYGGGCLDHAVDPQLFPVYRKRNGRLNFKKRDPRQAISEKDGDEKNDFPNGKHARVVFSELESVKLFGVELQKGVPQKLPQFGSEKQRVMVVNKVLALDFLELIENFDPKSAKKLAEVDKPAGAKKPVKE